VYQYTRKITVVLFDYGGVLAEEGFREGLKEIARAEGLDPESFFHKGADIVYSSGYVTGTADEHAYWNALRENTGIRKSDAALRGHILKRFVLRPWIFDIVKFLRKNNFRVGILSDQTQWLDELNARDGNFFREFEFVFNSFHMGLGKKDRQVFAHVAKTMGAEPSEILFIDDNPENIERARESGFFAILFVDRQSLIVEMQKLGLPVDGTHA
jgi:putative hydrolase of the HAD superfamily